MSHPFVVDETAVTVRLNAEGGALLFAFCTYTGMRKEAALRFALAACVRQMLARMAGADPDPDLLVHMLSESQPFDTPATAASRS